MRITCEREIKEFFNLNPEAKEAIEDFDFQYTMAPDYLYRKATVADVKVITSGGWFGEPGIYAWVYPCGIPVYVWVAEMPPIGEEPCFDRFPDAESAYRRFKKAMYDTEYGYEPDDCDVLSRFGICRDGYTRQDWIRSWGYGDEYVEAYERARHDVLTANGWYE